jgi:hypothetical protein
MAGDGSGKAMRHPLPFALLFLAGCFPAKDGELPPPEPKRAAEVADAAPPSWPQQGAPLHIL